MPIRNEDLNPRDRYSSSAPGRYPLSCDNIVALSDTTVSGSTLVGKNSDRPATETQPLVYNEGGAHAPGETLNLAYRTISQVDQTYTTLGAAPYWCWGYEMGLNEDGLTIGNEAVFTRPLNERLDSLKDKEGANGEIETDNESTHLNDGSCGLLGMEFVRLGSNARVAHQRQSKSSPNCSNRMASLAPLSPLRATKAARTITPIPLLMPPRHGY